MLLIELKRIALFALTVASSFFIDDSKVLAVQRVTFCHVYSKITWWTFDHYLGHVAS